METIFVRNLQHFIALEVRSSKLHKLVNTVYLASPDLNTKLCSKDFY